MKVIPEYYRTHYIIYVGFYYWARRVSETAFTRLQFTDLRFCMNVPHCYQIRKQLYIVPHL